MLLKVQHAICGTVTLDTEMGVWFQLPELEGKDFYANSNIRFFKSIKDFLISDVNECIFPVFCIKKYAVKRRIAADVISANDTYIFYNVEMINGKWGNNAIEKMEERKAYFAFCEKNSGALHNVLIKRVKLIENNVIENAK